jgi:hypothetical protein
MEERDPNEEHPYPDTAQEQPLPLEHAGEGKTAEDEVEESSEDSFPASDPPSFTRSTTD